MLAKHGAQVVVISRTGENNYHNLDCHKDAAVIVNTTPVGMYPNVGNSPVELSLFPELKAVLDVVYNPARTQLLLDAEKLGIPWCNGLLMLVAQAKEAAEWFLGTSLPESVIAPVLNALERNMHNIVLIGMPGCGKSTVGQLLEEQTGLKFLDADEEIVSRAGKSIPEIFRDGGEDAFRALETEVLANLGMQSGLIIATGGGCVTRQNNYPLLHQNGSIFWLMRDLALLPKDGRPLSLANDLSAMYEIRKPIYEAFADHIISNQGAVENTVLEIMKIWEGSV